MPDGIFSTYVQEPQRCCHMNSHQGYVQYADCSGLYNVKPRICLVISCFQRLPLRQNQMYSTGTDFWQSNNGSIRSQWLLCLRYGSLAARFQGFRIRIRPGAWRSVSCDCCMLSGRGLCFGLITRPQTSYRLSCVCDCEASIMRRSCPTGGCCAIKHSLWQSEIVILLRNVKLQNRMQQCLLLALNLPTSPLLETLFLSTSSSTQNMRR